MPQIVEEEGQSRCLWRLARINSLITGKDGHVRGAVLHVPSDKGIKTLQRPLQHLYPLEVTSKPVEHSQEQSPTDAPSVDTAEKDSPDHAANTTESEDILPTLTKRSMMNIRLICHEVKKV